MSDGHPDGFMREYREHTLPALRAKQRREAELIRGRHFDATLAEALTAVRSETGKPITPPQELLCRDVAALAAEAPAISIRWLHGAGRSTALVSGGVYLYRSRTTACWPIVDEVRFAVAAHELGHGRGDRSASEIARETSAWKWAMTHARVWTRPMHDEMCDALRTYLPGAASHDVVDVMDAEALMTERTYRANMRPLGIAIAAEERQRFRELHGNRMCEGALCGSAPRPATRCVDGFRFFCGLCYDARELDALASRLILERVRHA
jgi:hypothetical protein